MTMKKDVLWVTGVLSRVKLGVSKYGKINLLNKGRELMLKVSII